MCSSVLPSEGNHSANLSLNIWSIFRNIIFWVSDFNFYWLDLFSNFKIDSCIIFLQLILGKNPSVFHVDISLVFLLVDSVFFNPSFFRCYPNKILTSEFQLRTPEWEFVFQQKLPRSTTDISRRLIFKSLFLLSLVVAHKGWSSQSKSLGFQCQQPFSTYRIDLLT